MMTQHLKPPSQLEYANMLVTNFSPSKEGENRSSAITPKEEVSILSPQEIGGMLKSQISTIPEEELDQEYGGVDQQSSAATVQNTMQNQTYPQNTTLMTQYQMNTIATEQNDIINTSITIQALRVDTSGIGTSNVKEQSSKSDLPQVSSTANKVTIL